MAKTTGPVAAGGLGSLRMPAVTFADPEIAHHRKIESLLKATGPDGHFSSGIIYEEINVDGKNQAVVHIGNPYLGNAMKFKTLPTSASLADITAISKKIIWTPEFCQMLYYMAVAKEQGTPIIIEGESSIGKSFAVDRFEEFLKGKGHKPIVFDCNNESDTGGAVGKIYPEIGCILHRKAGRSLKLKHIIFYF